MKKPSSKVRPKAAFAEVPVSSDLLERVKMLIAERSELGFLDSEEFIREALRLFLYTPKPEGSSGRSCSR